MHLLAIPKELVLLFAKQHARTFALKQSIIVHCCSHFKRSFFVKLLNRVPHENQPCKTAVHLSQ